MGWIRTALIGAMVLLMAGCAGNKTVTTTVNAQEAEQYNKRGTGTITGSALLRQQGGGVVTCAGSEVLLLADIPVTRQALSIVAKGDNVTNFRDIMQRYPGAFRTGTCNAQGFFRFEEVAAGSWQVATQIVWKVGYYLQGGWVAQSVVLGEGQTRDVVLSDYNLLR